LLDAQLFQQRRHLTVDELRTIVGVKAAYDKRELSQDQRQHWQQKGFADGLYAGLDLPLADRIHAGDVIDALDAVPVALMDGVDPHKAGPPVRRGSLAYPDGVAHRAGLGEMKALRLIAGALAQVVQVRRRKCRQALIARVTIVPVRSPQEVHDGRPTDPFMGFVHLNQQGDIACGVFACKRPGRWSVALDQRDRGQTIALPACDQTGDLRSAVATGVLQVTPQIARLTRSGFLSSAPK
jgi:hypothetical protein